MKQIVVLSGKGGTGKTTVTTALAQLLGPVVLADCDVDAPNLHLLLSPQVERSFKLKASRKAAIDPLLCDGCGACADNCRFGAITRREPCSVDAFKCEGCGVCGLVCPRDAVRYLEPDGAEAFIASTPYGPMVGAELAVGEEASGKVVTRVRAEAQLLAAERVLPLILVDGSPGTGCPVIASMSGADLALIVTEPTLSGRHDLDRIMQVAAHFDISIIVCINKCDINPRLAAEIRRTCREAGADVAAEIPFSEEIVEALRNGEPPLGNVPEEVEAPVRHLAKEIASRMGNDCIETTGEVM